MVGGEIPLREKDFSDFRFLEAQGIFKQNLIYLYVYIYISAIFGIIFYCLGGIGGGALSLARGSSWFSFSRSLRYT